jgi:hypothetical protein
MEDRDIELPVATMRPRHLLGRLAYLRGALRRWIVDKLRAGFRGRHAPFVLTGIAFSAMMLTMGYVANHAHRAGVAIDEMHRQQRIEAELQGVLIETAAEAPDDPWAAAVKRSDQTAPSPVLFYVRR